MANLELRGRILFPEHTDKLDWWQTATIYQIYPRSFQDSDGDGIGDLAGIRQRLDYFKELGIDCIWLSPFFKSPMKDFGYDISDFKAIEPMFGKLADFDGLLRDAHERGIRVILDYVPNHTSDQHEWFRRSRSEGPNGEYADFYMWRDGKVVKGKRQPPNNWLSVFSGSAWTWDPVRKQYYLHHFVSEQPDLNWRNPRVQREMMDVFRFWLDRGVDGFRIDAIGYLVEDKAMPDEPKSDQVDLPADDNHTLEHIYTYCQQETYDMVVKWRDFFNEYERKHKRDHILMVTEMYDEAVTRAVKFYDYGPDMPFNFNLCFMTKETDGLGLYKLVSSWLEAMPKGKWPNWVIGNHDRLRVSGLKGPEFVDAANGLVLLLPGTPTTYNGEELGMENIAVSYADTQDPYGRNQTPDRYHIYSRDPARSPMQWNADVNAGFSTASKTWLPVHPNYKAVNVEHELQEPNSHLNVYRQLVALRKLPAFQRGAMVVAVVDTHVFSFVRHVTGHAAYLVVVSLSDEGCQEDFCMELEGGTYSSGRVVVQSGQGGLAEVQLESLLVQPKGLLVIELLN